MTTWPTPSIFRNAAITDAHVTAGLTRGAHACPARVAPILQASDFSTATSPVEHAVVTYRVTFMDLQGSTSSFLFSCPSLDDAKRKAQNWGKAYRPGWAIDIEERPR